MTESKDMTEALRDLREAIESGSTYTLVPSPTHGYDSHCAVIFWKTRKSIPMSTILSLALLANIDRNGATKV